MLRRSTIIAFLGMGFGVFAPWSSGWAAPAQNVPPRSGPAHTTQTVAQSALYAARRASVNPFSPLRNRPALPEGPTHPEQLPPPPILGTPLPLAKGRSFKAPVLVGRINEEGIFKTHGGYILEDLKKHAK
jgi:hypothetical protein